MFKPTFASVCVCVCVFICVCVCFSSPCVCLCVCAYPLSLSLCAFCVFVCLCVCLCVCVYVAVCHMCVHTHPHLLARPSSCCLTWSSVPHIVLDDKAWINDVIMPAVCVPDDSGCIFENLKDIHMTEAACARHERQCPVTPVTLFSAGFSCKSLSKLNGCRSQMGDCLQMQMGSTGNTFAWMIDYLQAHRPALTTTREWQWRKQERESVS